ncbi:uncharacterized protein A1O9_01661 [Exophiala aquamarina CBS 119918]|uniref:Alpha-methylacyl-CoA racemase n=1 Tax=Exophiala aquamarina CBS 119918 TaxID=1182545 RepID=A0A072PWE1_9EURO|nr:uncharacterized protein A1O9_01661 [Exophiala aquamarina CBS 119918]KEF63683.1 hypothetical protein A1O9_01661 [Exophiala aquamarina CBS 119918]
MATEIIHAPMETIDSLGTGIDKTEPKAGADELLHSSIPQEAKRILVECLVGNESLAMPQVVVEGAPYVTFTPEINSFMPTPMKMTESVSAIWACIGLFAAAILQRRYDIQPSLEIAVDVQAATLMLSSLVLFEIEGKGIADEEVSARAAHLDKGRIGETYRALATNIYKTADERWFQLHGSLDTTPMLEMLGLPQHQPALNGPLNRDAIKDIYKTTIARWDSQSLETEVNERWRQPGVTCLTKEEYAATTHGKANINELLYKVHPIHEQLQPTPWPQTATGQQPLSGIKVLDLTKVIAGPTITRVLALLGADVLRASSRTIADATFALFDGQLGKRDTDLDLKTIQGRAALQKLLEDADVVVDGFRPGVLDRLGFGTKWAHELARRRGHGIVYCRENCYGWSGEWRDRAGYQQISDCVSGASWEQGKFLGLDEPVVPLLPNSDYQTGLLGAVAIMQALLQRASVGGSYNVEVSLTQFNNWYLRDVGLHSEETQAYLRALHPGFLPRHDMDIFELITKTVEATKTLRECDAGRLWDRAKFATGPIRWGGPEGEIATYLDWRKIVTVKRENDEKPLVLFDFKSGSCLPGSDEPRWL